MFGGSGGEKHYRPTAKARKNKPSQKESSLPTVFRECVPRYLGNVPSLARPVLLGISMFLLFKDIFGKRQRVTRMNPSRLNGVLNYMTTGYVFSSKMFGYVNLYFRGNDSH